MSAAKTPDPLAHWYNGEQASERLKVSVATIERRVKRGEIEKRARPRGKGQKPEPVYNPDDIERLMPPPQLMPVLSPAAIPAIPTTPRTRAGIADIPLASAVEFLERLAAVSRPAPEKMYLTVAEAAEVSGLSEALIRRVIASGRLGFADGNAFKISRAELAQIGKLAK
jgi:excisionase family DNA binding protein